MLLFLLAITAVSFSNAQEESCTGMLSVDSSFTVEWETDEDDDYVQFRYSAATTNWVGLGFSLSGSMPNSDVVVGALADDGEYFVEDRYVGDDRIMPMYDDAQNIKNGSAYDDGTTTTISFIRPRVSPDNSEDIDLDQCVFVIWAFGGSVSSHETPASFVVHTSRGVFASQLCLQECGASGLVVSMASLLLAVILSVYTNMF